MRDQNIPVLTSSVFPKHTNLSDELELQIKFRYHMIYFNPRIIVSTDVEISNFWSKSHVYWLLFYAIFDIFNSIGYAFGQYYVVIRLYFC